jgi:asparagine synthase (glutamine-hydrolysing)
MCGIWAFLNNKKDLNVLFKNFMNIKHRGPDYSSFQIYDNLIVGFHRLAIMDLSFSSNQPYILKENNKTIVFVCNGEIYNYQELINKYSLKIDNKSDCLTIPHLYLKMKYNEWIQMFTDEIKGEFAFLLFEFDESNKLTNLVAGRDAIGIRPLYWSKINNLTEQAVFSSEIKGCDFDDLNITEFKPGHIVSLGKQHSYDYDFKDIYTIKQYKQEESQDADMLTAIKESVINSVKRRLDADQPIAFLLSGGVDSSIVASIASKLSPNKIRTFCCGMKGGSDLAYAKMVAEHIGSEHTEVIFTQEEALAVINDVIYTTETWDTTTIRASVGQYLVSKYISEHTDAKVLFVGEGPDEVCSSYLFNWYAPDSELIHPSAMDYVKNIYYYDVKRCDRCIARWGLEARVALLDPEFIKAYWKIPSHERFPKTRGIEKWWFRKAFDTRDDNYLPDAVLWRKKEAFSDGVSSTEKSWFQIIQEHLMEKYNMCEKDYFKSKFIEFFGEKRLNIIPDYWQPRWNKNGELITSYVDPSARTLDIYNENN